MKWGHTYNLPFSRFSYAKWSLCCVSLLLDIIIKFLGMWGNSHSSHIFTYLHILHNVENLRYELKMSFLYSQVGLEVVARGTRVRRILYVGHTKYSTLCKKSKCVQNQCGIQRRNSVYTWAMNMNFLQLWDNQVTYVPHTSNVSCDQRHSRKNEYFFLTQRVAP